VSGRFESDAMWGRWEAAMQQASEELQRILQIERPPETEASVN
jgi:hypothetical protein